MLLPWVGSEDLCLLDGKVCAQPDMAAVPVWLPGDSRSRSQWSVVSEGAEGGVTDVVENETYILRMSMNYSRK